jgi:hypothetical protein
MSKDLKGHDTPEATREALVAADALISRIEELVADQLAAGERLDEKEAFYRIVELLETAPEIAKVRLALGQDPARFGEPTPFAAGDHTG